MTAFTIIGMAMVMLFLGALVEGHHSQSGR
jgi:hypothetical protein